MLPGRVESGTGVTGCVGAACRSGVDLVGERGDRLGVDDGGEREHAHGGGGGTDAAALVSSRPATVRMLNLPYD